MSPALEARLASIRARVEEELDAHLPDPAGDPTRLAEAMRYCLLGGGKRLRPALVVLGAEASGGSSEEVWPAACAVEMIHAYSLVHDDLPAMDDDALRRGRATCHLAFDEATAILVGDGLQALAFETLARGYAERPALGLALVRLLAEAAGVSGMVGGQALDMSAAGQPGDLPALERLHRRKTGALFRAALLLGARCGGAEGGSSAWVALEAYGQSLGLAFQVADDILDCTASSQVLGKTAGKDAAQDKLTYMSLLGLQGARAKAEALRDQALQRLEGLGPAAQPLRDLARYVVARSN